MKDKYFKCVYQLKEKIQDKRWLFGKVYHQGTFRGFFKSKKDCIEYAKKLNNCKKVISVFSNDDILQLAKDLKDKLKKKGYLVNRHYVVRYKSDKSNRSKAGVDMISIYTSNPEKAYKEKFINEHNIGDLNFATKDIPYAKIHLN
jgi:hypothetical protein